MIKLTKVPRFDRLTLGRQDLDEALYLLAEDANFDPLKYRFSRLSTLFASRACRTAVMIGTALTRSQMEQSVRNMAEMDQPWNCPHGRPTLRHLINLQMLIRK
jgi:DNA mismatch repair protein PMS2